MNRDDFSPRAPGGGYSSLGKRASGALACLLAALSACGKFPAQHPLVTRSLEGERLVVRDGHGELAQDEVRRMLDAVVGDAVRVSHAERVLTLEEMLTGEPLYSNNSAELLVDGPRTYDAMMAAIDGATGHVYLETYIFSDGPIGHRFAERLVDKRREGVDVRIIYDAVGSRETEASFFARLREHGVSVRAFNPVVNVQSINNRDHRRILVVDGQVAFTGGVNVSGEYGDGSFVSWTTKEDLARSWRDTHVMVRGPAVRAFEDHFLRTWDAIGGDAGLRTGRANPARAPTSSHGALLVRVIGSRGGNSHDPFHRAYRSAIEHAQARVWITQGYFVPDPVLIGTLERAAGRGLDVRILLSGVHDSRFVHYASQSHYERLLEAGVKLYERNDAVVHAKTAVIDGYWSLVGTSNLDYRSVLHNDELNAVIVGNRFAARMERLFGFDLQHAERIEPAQWAQRSLWRRMMEQAAVAFEYWL